LEKVRFLIKPFGSKYLLIILASLLLLATSLSEVASARTNKNDKKKIFRQIAQNYIELGTEEYRRGLYAQAERSFLRAQHYQKYLTDAERKKLNDLLEKAHKAVVERERIVERIQAADKLIKEGQLVKAKTQLEDVKDSEFLTESEREKTTEGLKRLAKLLAKQTERIAQLYKLSVEAYRSGQLEKARAGFVKVAQSSLLTGLPGKTAEDYIAEIDKIFAERGTEVPHPEVGRPAEAPQTPITVEDELLRVVAGLPKDRAPEIIEEPNEGEGTNITVVNRRRRIRRHYAEVIVKDANENAQNYISQGEFEKAQGVVDRAKRTVDEYQLDLGDSLYKAYSSKLKELSDEIARRSQEQEKRLQAQRLKEAMEAQERLRKQAEAERQQRIKDIMENAIGLQKKQKYEEALGQLRMLLVLDPQHDDALILKDTLEDMIYWRREAEVRKEASKQRAEMLLKTDEAGTPYAEELVHPKDWAEIVASPFRRPDEAISQDPADAAVYKQLDEIVDLTMFHPDMPLSKALDEIRIAVEPPLKIVVLWRDLIENADIDQDTKINMGPISAARLGTALELLLKSVSSGLAMAELGYVVENGVITIATKDSLPTKMETRVYDVTILLGRPADYYGMEGMNGGRIGGSSMCGI